MCFADISERICNLSAGAAITSYDACSKGTKVGGNAATFSQRHIRSRKCMSPFMRQLRMKCQPAHLLHAQEPSYQELMPQPLRKLQWPIKRDMSACNSRTDDAVFSLHQFQSIQEHHLPSYEAQTGCPLATELHLYADIKLKFPQPSLIYLISLQDASMQLLWRM